MPIRMWKHSCGTERGELWGEQTCRQCGRRGEYAGWFITRFEAMAWHQKTYGLKPIGLHRPFADQIFDKATVLCRSCAGRGLVDVNQGERYSICAVCQGAQVVLVVSPIEFEQLRLRVLDAFPDAGASTAIANPVGISLVHDLKKGVIIPLDDDGTTSPAAFRSPKR